MSSAPSRWRFFYSSSSSSSWCCCCCCVPFSRCPSLHSLSSNLFHSIVEHRCFWLCSTQRPTDGEQKKISRDYLFYVEKKCKWRKVDKQRNTCSSKCAEKIKYSTMSMARIFREDYTWLSEIVKWKRIASALEFQYGTQKKMTNENAVEQKENQHLRALQNCAVYNKILIIGIVESFGNTVFMTFLLESNVKWLSWFVL